MSSLWSTDNRGKVSRLLHEHREELTQCHEFGVYVESEGHLTEERQPDDQ
jgi:hypothetical protein